MAHCSRRVVTTDTHYQTGRPFVLCCFCDWLRARRRRVTFQAGPKERIVRHSTAQHSPATQHSTAQKESAPFKCITYSTEYLESLAARRWRWRPGTTFRWHRWLPVRNELSRSPNQGQIYPSRYGDTLALHKKYKALSPCFPNPASCFSSCFNSCFYSCFSFSCCFSMLFLFLLVVILQFVILLFLFLLFLFLLLFPAIFACSKRGESVKV